MISITERFPDQARSRQACRYILRLISSKALQPGDQLPPQDVLRDRSGFAHDTLSRAMGALVQAGVLTRKPRVGTLVKDPEALQEKLWTVALTYPHRVVSGYFAMLQVLAMRALERLDCSCRTYLCDQEEWPSPKGFTVGCFPGLGAEVQVGRVDAVLSLLHVDMPELEVASVGNRSAPTACYNDLGDFCIQAIRMVRQRGARRIMTVVSGTPDYFHDDVIDAVGPLGLGVEVMHKITFIEEGMSLGRQLLQRRPEDRPDALLVLTDHSAMGLCSALAGSDYRPDIAVLTHPQLRQVFALPVFRYEVDIQRVADCAANLLVDRLMDPDTPQRCLPIKPRLVSGGPTP